MSLFTHPRLIGKLSAVDKGFSLSSEMLFTSPSRKKKKKIPYSTFTVKLISSIKIPHGFRKSRLFITFPWFGRELLALVDEMYKS